ncbi:MAG: SDR family oxidoreductase [Lentisphaerae bacterium]|nr:SDR family oxidoreductase [Lentisphaerota bacterium]
MSAHTRLFDLSGHTALVTGGNTGIGLGMALGLAGAGARVAVVGRDPDKNKAALKMLRPVNRSAAAFVFDLKAISGIPAFFKSVSRRLGGIDILVNNAGVQCRGRADRVPIAAFEKTVRLNLTAPYALAQCFARERMAAGKPGCILFTASLMSEAARPTTSAYTATKGAIRQLVKALAVDWAPHGIRVNGIGPGYIRTEMTRPLFEDPAFDEWVRKRTPQGRWGTPDDLGGVAVFLASEAARFITGQIVYVDGGWLAAF